MKVRVAVQGCCHGELDVIYRKLNPKKVDLLVITGDFQAIRNVTDLESMAVPPKYKRLGDFYRYYNGERKATIPTIFIGGNHESSGYLKELKYGGWVAPNIYYLGEFGTVWYKGLRISGISGIYNEHSFNRNVVEDEKVPFNPSTLRSVYHIKPKNYVKMLLMKSHQQQIVVSHDWPQYIYNHGNLDALLSKKPFFQQDIASGRLGSPVTRVLYNHLTPTYWFASHLHVKFEATVDHIDVPKTNTDEIDMDMDDMDEIPDTKSIGTQFLALDKCGRNRKHLEIKEIESNQDHISCGDSRFYYDQRAIAINRVVETYIRHNDSVWKALRPIDLLNIKDTVVYESLLKLVEQEMENVKVQLNSDSNLSIPTNFVAICPAVPAKPPLKQWESNQTTEYCNKFDIPSD